MADSGRDGAYHVEEGQRVGRHQGIYGGQISNGENERFIDCADGPKLVGYGKGMLFT